MLVTGTPGDDSLVGGSRDDTLDGATGTDNIQCGAGNDPLGGWADDDTLFGGAGRVNLDGGTVGGVLGVKFTANAIWVNARYAAGSSGAFLIESWLMANGDTRTATQIEGLVGL